MFYLLYNKYSFTNLFFITKRMRIVRLFPVNSTVVHVDPSYFQAQRVRQLELVLIRILCLPLPKIRFYTYVKTRKGVEL